MHLGLRPFTLTKEGPAALAATLLYRFRDNSTALAETGIPSVSFASGKGSPATTRIGTTPAQIGSS